MAKYRVYIRRRSTRGAHDSGPFARFNSMEIQMKQSFKKIKTFLKAFKLQLIKWHIYWMVEIVCWKI